MEEEIKYMEVQLNCENQILNTKEKFEMWMKTWSDLTMVVLSTQIAMKNLEETKL